MPYAMFPLPYRGGESIAKGQIEFKYLLISFLLDVRGFDVRALLPRRGREGLEYVKKWCFSIYKTQKMCVLLKKVPIYFVVKVKITTFEDEFCNGASNQHQ